MMRMAGMSWRALALAAIPALLLHGTGCVMPISVQYSSISAAETLHRGDPPVHVYVTKFTDAREKQKRIGALKNGLGMTIKGLATTDDFGAILAEAATDALRKAGIGADLTLDRLSGDPIPAAEMKGYNSAFGGRLTHVEVKGTPGWDTFKITAKVVMDVCVASAGKLEWIGPIEGTAERREINLVTAQPLSLALDSALQDCMRNMVRHLKASGGVTMLRGK